MYEETFQSSLTTLKTVSRIDDSKQELNKSLVFHVLGEPPLLIFLRRMGPLFNTEALLKNKGSHSTKRFYKDCNFNPKETIEGSLKRGLSNPVFISFSVE